MLELIWPTCFLTGVVPTDRTDVALCADALSAWAIVCSGSHQPRPAHFGEVMVTIALRLGVDGTPESFMGYSSILLNKE